MNLEDYQRLIRTLNDVHVEDDACIVIVQRKNKEITVGTYGEVRPLTALKAWAFKWLGGRE